MTDLWETRWTRRGLTPAGEGWVEVPGADEHVVLWRRPGTLLAAAQALIAVLSNPDLRFANDSSAIDESDFLQELIALRAAVEQARQA